MKTPSRTFGKRTNPNAPPAARTKTSEPPRAGPSGSPRIDDVIAPAETAPPISVDQELKAWRAARREQKPFRFPWRQLSLMASLCFGIASFVLPESVNETVGWVLDGLALAAFAAWLGGRRRPPEAAELRTTPAV